MTDLTLTLTLTEALAEVKPHSDWNGAHFLPTLFRAEIRDAIATILNAVLSGDLIPRADAELAVAEAIRRAAEIGADIAQRTRPDGFPEEASNAYHSGAMDVVDAIRALITEKPHDRA